MKKLYQEIIQHVFEYYPPNEWNPYLYVLVYDSEIYPVREFAIVFDLNYNMLYYGWDVGEAYYDSIQAPKRLGLLDISYIRNIEDDSYVFFDESGKNLNQGLKFIKMDCMDGEIMAKVQDNKWYMITKDGPIPEKKE